MSRVTYYRRKAAGTLPRPTERPACAMSRADAIDLDAIDFAKFGMTSVKMMRGTDVECAWPRRYHDGAPQARPARTGHMGHHDGRS
ncbi:hypothetical protein AXW67_17590 [Bradyrhizobium neotropicale]|uniref:Uncharacterized protein n=1 Tax=Bradyrhizobium neotropicale TaxID=1497615 RepID=A0A176Z369_9BRAD|nr:hypothetical protein AXW67_17590 [Bradyrhizobium neotropicale]